MPASVDISDPFRALSDPTRREIVRLLAAGPLPVRMIAGHFPSISRPAVSKHLRILREGRLVDEQRSGRERLYRLDLGTLGDALGWLAGVRSEALEAGAVRRPARRGAKRSPERRIGTGRKVRPRAARQVAEPATAGRERPAPAGALTDEDGWKSW